MQSLDVQDAKDAWFKMAGSKESKNTWCIFAEGKRDNKRVLKVIGTGKGAGMRSIVTEIKTFVDTGEPAWGGFRVDAVDDRLNAKAVCPRFVGFQLVPEACSFKQRSKVLEIKGVLTTKVMTNLALMFDCETWQELNDATGIARRLRATCGAHVPTLYDFGGSVKRRTSVGERDGLPTSRPCLVVDLAQEAWQDIMNDSDDSSYVLFNLTKDSKALEILAFGCGPGLVGCKLAAEDAVKKQIPFWGGYRVNAIDEGDTVTSVRTKFVGFQVIPSGTPPMAKSKVSIVKPMIQSRVMPFVSCFIEAETVAEICDPDVIAGKLNKSAGSDAPTTYDFKAVSPSPIIPEVDPGPSAEEKQAMLEQKRQEQIAARRKKLEEGKRERMLNSQKGELETKCQMEKASQNAPEDQQPTPVAKLNEAAEETQLKTEEIECGAEERLTCEGLMEEDKQDIEARGAVKAEEEEAECLSEEKAECLSEEEVEHKSKEEAVHKSGEEPDCQSEKEVEHQSEEEAVHKSEEKAESQSEKEVEHQSEEEAVHKSEEKAESQSEKEVEHKSEEKVEYRSEEEAVVPVAVSAAVKDASAAVMEQGEAASA